MASTEKLIERLPRWAQTEIAKLRGDLADARKTIAAATGERKTRVEVDPYRAVKGDPNKVYLREEIAVRYHLPSGYVDVHLVDNVLDIRAQDGIVLRPSSSNAIEIYNAKFQP